MNRTIIVVRGIPASGKTTWAKQWVLKYIINTKN